MKFPGVVAVLCVVPSGLVLHIGITSCTFPPWAEMSKKNRYELIQMHELSLLNCSSKKKMNENFKNISYFDEEDEAGNDIDGVETASLDAQVAQLTNSKTLTLWSRFGCQRKDRFRYH